MSIAEPLRKALDEAGGEAGVERILRKFYKTMAGDILLGFFFTEKELEPIVQGQKEFLLHAAGLVKKYTKKTPREAHRTLPPILKGHFDRRLVILREILEAEGLSPESIDAWIDYEDTFRKGIIEEEMPMSKRTRYKDKR